MIYLPILSDMGLKVVDIAEADGIRPDKPVENALTVTANAVIKAKHYHCDRYPHVFAHDVGICFDALDDEPGVQARRWGGKLADDVDDHTWMDYLLMRMKDVPDAQRTGRFVVGWALATTDGQVHSRVLESPFTLAHAPLRPMTPGSPMTALIHGEQDMIRQRQADFATQLRQWEPLKQLAHSVR
jgi:hypothetical protein